MVMTIFIDNIEKVKEFNTLTLKFPCEIDVISSRYTVDAKSLMGLFSLDLSKPVNVRFDDEYEDLAKVYFSKFEVVE